LREGGREGGREGTYLYAIIPYYQHRMVVRRGRGAVAGLEDSEADTAGVNMLEG